MRYSDFKKKINPLSKKSTSSKSSTKLTNSSTKKRSSEKSIKKSTSKFTGRRTAGFGGGAYCLDICSQFSAEENYQTLQRNGSFKIKKKERSFKSKEKNRDHALFVIMTLLRFWKHNGFQVSFITLTLPGRILFNYLGNLVSRLKERVERVLGFMELRHAVVLTEEGNGVAHLILSYKGEKHFWIDRRWLVLEWTRLIMKKVKVELGVKGLEEFREKLNQKTGGDVAVWIEPVGDREKDIKKLALYLAYQKKFKRFSWSWHRWKKDIGFAFRKGFRLFSKIIRAGKKLIDFWDKLISKGSVVVGVMEINLLKLKEWINNNLSLKEIIRELTLINKDDYINVWMIRVLDQFCGCGSNVFWYFGEYPFEGEQVRVWCANCDSKSEFKLYDFEICYES